MRETWRDGLGRSRRVGERVSSSSTAYVCHTGTYTEASKCGRPARSTYYETGLAI